MSTVASVLLVLAALLHVYIWWLESFAWTAPRTRATFGTSAEQAEQTRPLAFNQGFYNLFLAVVVLASVVVRATGPYAASVALAVAGAGSMLAAALVLVASDRSKARAAATQGTLPALALITVLLAR
ncbi:DUF1304 domain-containing protein [Flexivirga caeni]|uniref:DUF1304 domain-containing protein n=1 Tax=Flexivirga caeni TaxID=2294115 RepID=A0A3M9M4J5_9MICO|nr:DUF1304 domain-containing protein [Flexivirga caeni]RNI19853.1 DUF1304 domain-containing protein [Flexivirga caeni]